MNNLLEKLKERKKYIEKFETKIENNKETKEKNIFSKIEEIDGRKIYYTKIFKHLIDFRVTNNRQRLRITFQKFNDAKGWHFFNLFPLKEDDKFIGIKYGWDKLDKAFFLKDDNNKRFAIKKIYYIEFKFKKGSVKSYVLSLHTLLRKEKENIVYYQFTLEYLKKMENKVYEFFNKKLPKEGILDKWIKKNQLL